MGLQRVTTDIAHDLRTPLSRLRQRLERAQAGGGTTDELRDAIARSIDHVDNILETFGALLHIAQLESTAGTRPPQVLDLSRLLASIVDDFSPAAEDEGQNLTADIPEGLTLSGDPELITQMMANLVDNAIRHCPRGTSIHIAARSDADTVVIAVSDNGLGIPPDERDKVLRPFYRLEASRATEGNGLGLSMVAAIAKWHHADVELGDNSPGLRVTIKFRKSDRLATRHHDDPLSRQGQTGCPPATSLQHRIHRRPSKGKQICYLASDADRVIETRRGPSQCQRAARQLSARHVIIQRRIAIERPPLAVCSQQGRRPDVTIALS